MGWPVMCGSLEVMSKQAIILHAIMEEGRSKSSGSSES